MTKIEDRYWIETNSFAHTSHSTLSDATSGIKGTAQTYLHAPQTKTPITLVFHVLKSFQMLERSVVNLILFLLLYFLTFL